MNVIIKTQYHLDFVGVLENVVRANETTMKPNDVTRMANKIMCEFEKKWLDPQHMTTIRYNVEKNEMMVIPWVGMGAVPETQEQIWEQRRKSTSLLHRLAMRIRFAWWSVRGFFRSKKEKEEAKERYAWAAKEIEAMQGKPKVVVVPLTAEEAKAMQSKAEVPKEEPKK